MDGKWRCALRSARTGTCSFVHVCVACLLTAFSARTARTTSRLRQRWAQLGARQPVTLQPLPSSPTRALDFPSLNPCSGSSGSVSGSTSSAKPPAPSQPAAVLPAWPPDGRAFVRPSLRLCLSFRLLLRRLACRWKDGAYAPTYRPAKTSMWPLFTIDLRPSGIIHWHPLRCGHHFHPPCLARHLPRSWRFRRCCSLM